MKILLPIDGAQDAKLILDMVANFNWPPGSEFILLHVMPPYDNAAGLEEQTQQRADKLLTEQAQHLRRLLPKYSFERRTARGIPSEKILSFATYWGANMIVMGWRAGRQAERFLAGSVSQDVSLKAPCSVTVVRPPMDARNIAENERTKTASAVTE